MNERVLKDFECFEEIPDGALEVKEGCNLMYIMKGPETFVAREFIESIGDTHLGIKTVINYYDVINNENKLTIKIIKEESGIEKRLYDEGKIKIIPLSEILHLKGSSVSYMEYNDIVYLINPNEKPKEIISRSHYQI